MENFTTATANERTEELLAQLTRDLVELLNTHIATLPVSTQNAIDAALRGGAELAVLCVLVPRPSFVAMLQVDSDKDPVALFRLNPGADTLRLVAMEKSAIAQ
ncbi:MAG: hypothetical protein HOP18_14790 [Deltaproteobacteria bacterium]|nr:hypothetical protein [Deltaproteobacteria bacterium]